MEDTTKHHPDPESLKSGYELSDINLRTISQSVIILGLFTIAVAFGTWFLFDWLASEREKQDAPPPAIAAGRPTMPPEPRLQDNPRKDLSEYRRTEEEILTTYGWSDSKEGKLRIPIAEAMDRVAKNGLPPAQKPAAPAGARGTAAPVKAAK